MSGTKSPIRAAIDKVLDEPMTPVVALTATYLDGKGNRVELTHAQAAGGLVTSATLTVGMTSVSTVPIGEGDVLAKLCRNLGSQLSALLELTVAGDSDTYHLADGSLAGPDDDFAFVVCMTRRGDFRFRLQAATGFQNSVWPTREDAIEAAVEESA